MLERDVTAQDDDCRVSVIAEQDSPPSPTEMAGEAAGTRAPESFVSRKISV